MNRLLEQLEQMAQTASRDLERCTSGQSVCRLHKQGQVSIRLKYCEGRDYAVRAVLRKGQKTPEKSVLVEGLNVLERKNSAVKQSLVLTSPDWQSYADGVLSMVAEIRVLLSSE